MKKNNGVVKYLLENYDIKNANDIAYAQKDVFKYISNILSLFK